MKDQERVPLRVVLRNFLNHIENLESQTCPEKSYEAEFQDLKIFSENVKCIKGYSCMEGEKEVNRKKNRYKDILPFDLSRVVLNKYAGIPGSDYINANFIKGASGSPAYIASQGPLPSTVNDFWRMVVQCEVQVIVMACNEEEAGKAKCEKYWVDEGDERQFGMISVKLLKSSTVCPDFSVRTMRLKYTNSQSAIEERTVCQLHFVAWPDHGVPTVVQPLLDMVRLVRDTQASETLPVLIHCSAGCGRTGTICAIDYVWGLLRTGKLTGDFSLLGLIRDMRKQRIAMVQTKEQYVLVHQAVRELFKEQLCMIDSHPYENVDPNGLLVIKDEENTYDCIEYVSTCSSEEKHDSKKENEIKPPPLPCKKNLTIFSSKHEKDVENLTAQQKAIYSHSNEKKKNVTKTSTDLKHHCNRTFFRSSVEKTPKKLSNNHMKPDINKPIPSKGILRVPQLESLTPKCTTSIKRSKSLKVVSSCDKNNLTICPNPSENKRRSSLESNFDDHILESEYISYDMTNFERGDNLVQKKKSVLQKTSKYDFIRNQEQMPFLRSFTSLDLRQKFHSSNINSKSNIVPFSDEKVSKQKCKLLRSNTQINVVKKRDAILPNLKGSSFENDKANANHRFATEDPTGHYSHMLNFDVSLENLKETNSYFKCSLASNSSSRSRKHGLAKTQPLEKEPINQKVNGPPKQKLHSFQNFGLSGKNKVSRDLTKKSSPFITKPDISNIPVPNSYVSEKKNKSITKSDKSYLYGIKLSTTSSQSESSDSSSANSRNSSHLRINHLKQMNGRKMLQLSKSLELPGNNGLSLVNSSKEDMRLRQISTTNQDEFLHPNFSSEDPAHGSHYLSSCFTDHFHNDGISNFEHSQWVDRDRLVGMYAKPKIHLDCASNKLKPQSLYQTDYKESSSAFNNVLDIQKPNTSSIMVESVNEADVNYDLNSYDSSFNKEASSLLVSPGEIKYTMQNRPNINQYNGSTHLTRNPGAAVSSSCADTACGLTKTNLVKNISVQQRCLEPTIFNQDSAFYSQEPHVSYSGNSCFHSAPGIDLDQVAASMNKKDGNLMKVTLEAFQARKTKSVMTSKEKIISKGAVIPGSSSDKKKQQQYL